MIPELAGREAGHPDLSPFRTHRAQLRQWAQDKTVHVTPEIRIKRYKRLAEVVDTDP